MALSLELTSIAMSSDPPRTCGVGNAASGNFQLGDPDGDVFVKDGTDGASVTCKIVDNSPNLTLDVSLKARAVDKTTRQHFELDVDVEARADQENGADVRILSADTGTLWARIGEYACDLSRFGGGAGSLDAGLSCLLLGDDGVTGCIGMGRLKLAGCRQ